uniref:Uncharacterized protein n=1 Tax=Fagus sylvatica TaxID=28930 RepID=A0A2N9FMB7_FAGSY
MATTDVNTPVSNPELRTRIRHHCIVTKLMEVNKSLSDQCSYAWGKAVYEYLVCGLNHAVASKKAQKNKGNLHIQGCTALLQVLYVLAAMSWEQQEFVVQEATETLKETHDSSYTAVRLARHIKHLEDEHNHLKGMLATVIEFSPTVEQNQPPPKPNLKQNQPPEDVEQNQLPIPTEKTLIVDLPSLPSKAVKRDKPTKKKAKAAVVDLVSSPLKRDKRGRPAKNEGEAATTMVDLASSPSKLAKRGRLTKNEGEAAMVDLASSPSKGVLPKYQPKRGGDLG